MTVVKKRNAKEIKDALYALEQEKNKIEAKIKYAEEEAELFLESVCFSCPQRNSYLKYIETGGVICRDYDPFREQPSDSAFSSFGSGYADEVVSAAHLPQKLDDCPYYKKESAEVKAQEGELEKKLMERFVKVPDDKDEK